MDDDFNTPRALAVLFDVIGLIHETRGAADGEKDTARQARLERLAGLVALGRQLRDFFSLETGGEEGEAREESLMAPLIELLIETRQMARAAKMFAIADRVRNRLGELDINLEDHPRGTIWKRKES